MYYYNYYLFAWYFYLKRDSHIIRSLMCLINSITYFVISIYVVFQLISIENALPIYTLIVALSYELQLKESE